MKLPVAALLSLLFCAIGLAEPLRVGAAISMQEVLREIGKAYERETGSSVTFTFGSSGQVMAQIQNGAPIDVFISAAEKQVQDLADAGLTVEGSRRLVATNRLVLIVPPDSKDAPGGFESLANVRRLAIGEPRAVPAGQYAMQVLESLKLVEALSGKLVYGTNVRQVLSYVERGEVSAGIVYSTDARQSGEKVKVVAAADPRWHEPIHYSAVVIRARAQRESASAFLRFLGGDVAQKILSSYGFSPAATNEQ